MSSNDPVALFSEFIFSETIDPVELLYGEFK